MGECKALQRNDDHLKLVFLLLLQLKCIQMKWEIVSFRDRFDILLEKRLSSRKRLMKSREWRRGDSNPIRANTEPLHIRDNSATDCDDKPLEGISVKQNHNNSEHFNTLPEHQLGANMVRVNGNDPDLTMLLKSWPGLPEHIKAAIIALVQTHTTEK